MTALSTFIPTEEQAALIKSSSFPSIKPGLVKAPNAESSGTPVHASLIQDRRISEMPDASLL